MNRQFNRPQQPTLDRETVLRPRMNVDGPKVCCPKREHAAISPHLTGETYALLRYRLRAAAAILLVGFGAFYIKHIVGVLTTESLDILLLSAHTLVVLVLGLSLVPVCRKCPKTTPK